MVFIWSSKVVAALVMGMVILSVSLYMVAQAFEDIKQQRAEVDTRRVAQMAEVLDHKPGTVVQINFDATYGSVELTDDQVMVARTDGTESTRDINVHSDVGGGSVSDAEHVCVANDGGELTLSDSCDLPDSVTISGGETATPVDPADRDAVTCAQGSDIKTEYDRISSSDEDAILSETSDGLVFDPDQSASQDFMIYQQQICTSPREVWINLSFQQRGHIRIELRDAENVEDAGTLVSNINTDATGDPHIWLYCDNCPGTDGYEDTGVDYPLDTDYAFRIVQQDDGRVRWEFWEDGTQVYSIAREMPEFNRVSLVAWETWGSGQATADIITTIQHMTAKKR